ncbi:hypothetical protein TSUD_118010 [Trifolium subterraneum]|nr:hypothetical protein TSUD_118010 [Trifolium subterraneum]
MANFDVRRILVDQGSSCDIMYSGLFKVLQLTEENLVPYVGSDLQGFNGSTTKPWGYVDLIVTFGENKAMKSVKVKFLVVDCPSLYNCIIGRSTLAELFAVSSTIHLKLKYYTKDGQVATINGDIEAARRCFEAAFKNLNSVVTPRKKKAGTKLPGVNLISAEEVELDARTSKKERKQEERASKDDPMIKENYRPIPDGEFELVPIGEDPAKGVKIGADLPDLVKRQLKACLRENAELFTWSAAEMPGIDPEVACHQLTIDPRASAVVQRRRKQSPEKAEAARKAVKDLLEANFIAKAQYITWLSNVVLVKKSNGKWRMCVDYTDLNRVCLKDAYHLPNIDKLVDNSSGFKLLSFMDAYSGYNQIKMAEIDKKKTAFMTETGNYYYNVMPFGLKNAGATYQRMMNKVFDNEIGDMLEVYMDDMIVKSEEEIDHTVHLKRVFDQAKKCNMRFNPEKCTFGVKAGKFLGFYLTERGIEANPDKCRAFFDYPTPKSKKSIQTLNDMLTSMARFVAKSAQHALPLFKLLRKETTFEWTEECEGALQHLKRALSEPPVLTRPVGGEKLYLYLAVASEAISVVLIRETEQGQKPVYFVSRALQGPELRYLQIEKIALAVIMAVRKLRYYFLAHSIIIQTDQPALKAQVLADFVAEMTTSTTYEKNKWTIFVDGSSNSQGSGAGIILENGDGVLVEVSLGLSFPTTNNQAEYEAFLAGLRLAEDMRAEEIKIFTDSQLVASQVSGEYQTKEEQLLEYLNLIRAKLAKFKETEVKHVPREHNARADVLSKLASTRRKKAGNQSLIQETLTKPSIEKTVEVMHICAIDEQSWMSPVYNFLKSNIACSTRWAVGLLYTTPLRVYWNCLTSTTAVHHRLVDSDQAVSSVLQEVCRFVAENRNSPTGVERDLVDIINDLESIQALLKGAETKAADEEGGGANEGVKTWVKQLREISFRIEDVIDEYNMNVVQRANHSGFIAKIQIIPNMIKSMNWRYKMASQIQDIKSSLGKIKETGQRYLVKSENGSSKSRGSKAARFGDPQMTLYFNEETQLVGFESQREEMVRCLVEGTNKASVVSVVGMGGLGKTALAKLAFQDQRVEKHFDCRCFVIVSQSFNMRELLIDMIKKFCKDSNEPIPRGLHMSDGHKLITHVGQYLESKRYLILFDDVWKVNFSDEIQHALNGNNRGSRIIITTRRMHVAEYFKKPFPVHIHKLQPLSPEKAWELFCDKAFRGKCPKELGDMSHELVQICDGLPLAIVAIGGLLSTKPKTVLEWRQVNQNIRMELDRNVHMTYLRKILSLSYDDLPYHLKSCMLYFGIYPEHYTINRKRLIRQWIAEGFVRCEESRNQEEVAEEYVTELINRSLVHVSKVSFDGKVKSCHVHSLLREVIIKKMQDLSFCHLMHKDDEQETVGITRRFSIASISNNVLRSKSNSGIRAIIVFDKGELPKSFMDELSTKFELLKVLDFENALLSSIPDDLGNLFHLRYLNLSSTKVTVLPRSIGKLVNLETLDLRQTKVHQLPREINKLTKLSLLLAYYRKYGIYSILNFTTGVQMEEGVGCLKSLQKLYFLEADHGGVDLIQELKKLRQLRKFGIRGVRREYGNALCATIQEMKQLESLNITVIAESETLDLDFVAVPPPNLRVLNLKDGGFPKLKELDLTRLNKLSYVSIDKEALLGLEHFRFKNNPQLKVLPQDLQNLKNLQFLGFAEMPAELVDSIEIGGPCHWVINHIPLVQICENVGSKFHDYKLHRIPTQFDV